MKPAQLIFVYNADSGLFNTLGDIAHKLLSPQTYSCNLCAITHGYFREREQWRRYIENLPYAVTFLHRDEFRKQYPEKTEPFPAIYRDSGQQLVQVISREEINACSSIEELQSLINEIEIEK